MHSGHVRRCSWAPQQHCSSRKIVQPQPAAQRKSQPNTTRRAPHCPPPPLAAPCRPDEQTAWTAPRCCARLSRPLKVLPPSRVHRAKVPSHTHRPRPMPHIRVYAPHGAHTLRRLTGTYLPPSHRHSHRHNNPGDIMIRRQPPTSSNELRITHEAAGGRAFKGPAHFITSIELLPHAF